MEKIFISYRRQDSADVTGRIYDRLREHFGKNAIFIDVDNIPLGVDFRTHISNEVSQCDVLLAVIGKDWLVAEYSNNELRLNDPADFVRIEIETALRREIPVIPLLVQGASIPESNRLPDSMQDLVFRNAQNIRSDPDFNVDVNRLIDSLVSHFGKYESGTPSVDKLNLNNDELSASDFARAQELRKLEELKRVRNERKHEIIEKGNTFIYFLRRVGLAILLVFFLAIVIQFKDADVSYAIGLIATIVGIIFIKIFWWRISADLVWRYIDRWLNP